MSDPRTDPIPCILVADDDPDDQLLIRDAFLDGRIPGSVYCLDSGEEVVDYMDGKPPFDNRRLFPAPRAIFVDLNMPGMSGRELVRTLRAEKNCPDIPIIVMSTTTNVREFEQALTEGAQTYFSKPRGYSELIQVLEGLSELWGET